MPTYDCDDFRVAFEQTAMGSYDVVARAADGRELRSTFGLPMSTDHLEQAVLQLGRSRSTREVEPEVVSAVRANAEQLGGELGRALFDGPLGPFYDEARQLAATNGRGVRLTLSLAATPELLSVPWEILYRRPTFLASQRRTPIVRYLDVGHAPPPAFIDRVVRILGVVASPSGLPELDVAEERARVEKALAGMKERGLVELDWCDPAMPRTLRERLRDGSYHVLHYIGHSDFSNGEGLLYLENDEGGPAPVTESVLTNLLGDQTSLRLATLNSCEGARTTLTDPFAGIATSLVALGVPAVIAMQFTISDRAAIVFAEELFTSLIGRQYPIDAAVSEARKAVFTEVNEIEWATPVLFMQSMDGQLFDFMTAPQANLPPPMPPMPPMPVTPVPVVPSMPPPPTSPPERVATSVGAADGPAPLSESLQTLSEPPSGTRRGRRKGWIAAAVVAVVAITGGLAYVLLSDDSAESGPSGGSETPTLDITPSEGPLGTEILLRGDPCPAPPDSAVAAGIAYWMDIIVNGGSDVVAAADRAAEFEAEWHGSLVVPVDDQPGAEFFVGAVCWARHEDGTSANFFEYETQPFDVTNP